MESWRKEYLGSGITAVVSPEHGFGTDAVLLADFAAPSKRAVCCDLGTGCGIIPLLWCKKQGGAITAVDIQPQACRQLEQAIEINSLQSRLTVLNADLRSLKGKLPFGSFDVVTMNPPYKAAGAGIESTGKAQKIARHEIECSLDDVCTAAASLLNFSGKFCVCLRPERLCELFCSMRQAGIEPKRMRTVCKNHWSKPWLVLVEGRRGGKPGMTVESQLAVYEGKEYSPEMKEIYADYLLENRGEDK